MYHVPPVLQPDRFLVLKVTLHVYITNTFFELKYTLSVYSVLQPKSDSKLTPVARFRNLHRQEHKSSAAINFETRTFLYFDITSDDESGKFIS